MSAKDFLYELIRMYQPLLTRKDNPEELKSAGFIVEFLGNGDNIGTAFTAKEISANTNINKNTVRKELGILLRNKVIHKLEPKFTTDLTKYYIVDESKKMYRHLYGLETYCGGGKGQKAREQYYARTYKSDKENIRSELHDAIYDEISDTCGIDTWFKVIKGYEVKRVEPNEVDEKYLYPSIEVTQDL